MPNYESPALVPQVDLDAPWVPFAMRNDPVSDGFALSLVRETFNTLETWRGQNQDQRWRLNEWLYYGRVPQRTWEGTNVARASLPYNLSFAQVEAAHAKLCSALLTSDEILGVEPDGTTQPHEAKQIRERLNYILDHNIDDYGHDARAVLKLCMKDMLIYGNNFGLIEWDETRRQSVIRRLDPRDVYVDPSCPSPYIEDARSVQVRKLMTVDEIDAMRSIKGLNVPPRAVLNYLAQNRQSVVADRNKSWQEGARGMRYNPPADDHLPQPADRYIEVIIHQSKNGGREIWTLNRQHVMANMPGPYGCMRVVSAPCWTVPNRFYALSFVDQLDFYQNASTALMNRYLDETALALDPPRAAKAGVIRTPTSTRWRPGAMIETANPKEDMVVYQGQNVMSNVMDVIGFLTSQAETTVGQNSLSSSGLARPGNANRTKGGMQMQLQAPAERLGAIAANFEDYFFVPMLYKMLRVEKVHSEGDVYAKRGQYRRGR